MNTLTSEQPQSIQDSARDMEAYQQCGVQMTSYTNAGFQIMSIATVIAGLLIGLQQSYSDAAIVRPGDVPLLFGLVGLFTTYFLFSVHYRYQQAWLKYQIWASSIEEEWFGSRGGPVASITEVKYPFYVRSARGAVMALYFLLMAIWIANVLVYAVSLFRQ